MANISQSLFGVKIEKCEWRWMILYLTIFQLNILRCEYFIKPYGNNCDIAMYVWKIYIQFGDFLILESFAAFKIFQMKIKGGKITALVKYEIIFSSINIENFFISHKVQDYFKIIQTKDVWWRCVLSYWTCFIKIKKYKNQFYVEIDESKEDFQCKSTVSWLKELSRDIIKQDRNY